MRRLCFLIVVAAGLVGVGAELTRFTGGLSAQPLRPADLPRPLAHPQLRPAVEWFEQILRGLRRDEGPREDWDPSWERRQDRLFSPFDDEERDSRRGIGRYSRTMCVRLCDGFPIPMSFSTTRSQFAKDARRFSEACPAGRLFVYRNPGGDIEDMVDLDGRAYRQLSTAFLHQSTYVENCTCHGNPWDQEATARHQAYAAQAAQKATATKEAAVARGRKQKAPVHAAGRSSEPSR